MKSTEESVYLKFTVPEDGAHSSRQEKYVTEAGAGSWLTTFSAT